MTTWPGTRYLGPGNPLEAGDPVNGADQIAKLHDIAYEYAKDKKHIFCADKVAINDFADEFASGIKKWRINVGALAGAVGLCTKNLAESILNTTIYPWKPSSDSIPRDEKLALSSVREIVKIKYYRAKKKAGRIQVKYHEFWTSPEGLMVQDFICAELERKRKEFPCRFVTEYFNPELHADKILKCLSLKRRKSPRLVPSRPAPEVPSMPSKPSTPPPSKEIDKNDI